MNKQLITDLGWGVGIAAVALVAKWGQTLGLLDGETVTRLVFGLIGLMVASFGNRMPKTFVPGSRARQARRVAAWSLALSGLAYAALWTFASIPVAVIGGCIAVVLGMTVTLGYCMTLRSRAKAA